MHFKLDAVLCQYLREVLDTQNFSFQTFQEAGVL